MIGRISINPLLAIKLILVSQKTGRTNQKTNRTSQKTGRIGKKMSRTR